MAVSSSKVIHMQTFVGSCNSKLFSNFLRSLPVDCPSKLLMDNVAFHKSSNVKEELRMRSLEAIYVPPYSPQFNPIEMIFANVKQKCRRFVDANGLLELNNEQFVNDIVKSVREDVLYNSFAHVFKCVQTV